MRFKLTTLTIALLLSQYALGQQMSITGKVTDKATSLPIEYANISLLSQDSTFIKGVNSDTEGHFSINNTNIGNYLVAISYLGYETAQVVIDKPTPKNDLGNIALEPNSIALSEATVTAQSVINKPDRKLITPSESQMKTSTNGLDLLQKLQLPRLTIDHFNNKVTASGNGEVQLRINGVQVTNAEIVALRPEDIIRIEFHDDPGIRYGNAAAVLDYITRRRESGGNINGDFGHGVSQLGFADDYIAGKYNNKKSEFSVNSYWNYRNIDWTRTNDETFHFPDKEIHRLENGLPTKFKNHYINTALNYSLMEKDKYYLNATFRYDFSDVPNSYSDRKGSITTSYNPIPLVVTDHGTEKYNTPALDIYFQRNLKNEQLLIFNVVGTYISSTNRRNYTEYRGDNLETDINSHISGDKYSLIAEGIYERKLGESGKLTSGLKHKQTYANNTYMGDINKDISMKQAETYAYAQYQLKKGKLNYMVGTSVVRFYYSQSDKSQEKYLVQPSARINYNPNDNTYFRYRFNLWSHIPSLGELNDIQQNIDSLQVRRGNPNLKTNISFNHNLSAGYNKGIFGVDFNAQYTYRRKPVMESTLFEDGKFVRTSENQKGHHHLGLEATFKVKPYKEYINFSISPGLNRYVSEGNEYTHTYTNKRIRANLDVMYKNWIFSAWGSTSWDWFYGETMSEGETMYMMSIGYKKPAWSIMAGAFNPFGGDYKRYEENWSKMISSKNHIYTDDIKQMFLVKMSFNINFGRQFKSADRRINNSDTDAGLMSGAKK